RGCKHEDCGRRQRQRHGSAGAYAKRAKRTPRVRRASAREAAVSSYAICTNSLRCTMWAAVILGCTNSVIPTSPGDAGSQQAPPAQVVQAPTPASAGDPRGAWYVVWDRSSTGWKPTTFNGTMVLADDSVALTFRESSAAFTLDRVSVDGSNFAVDAKIPPRVPPADAPDDKKAAYAMSSDVQIRGFADSDQ